MNHDEFMNRMLTAFPNASYDVDNDGQFLIYTNLHVVTASENPSIPEGEYLIVDFDEERNAV